MSHSLPLCVHFAVSVPSHAHTVTHAVRLPCVAPVTGVHVPTLPATSHASHCSAQAASQHTPSTQIPEMQSAATAHPSALCPPIRFVTKPSWPPPNSGWNAPAVVG